jgi:hypothetical protein
VYEGYSESNLWWAINKTSNEKKILYTKNTYILKLFLNVVTAGIEELSSRNKFLYSCVKEIYRPWAQSRFDIFHKILIIVQALWSQPLFQVGKQVAVARSEIRAVRTVVKQLPVKMLHQCSSASSCMRTRIVVEKHYEYTGCQHSTPFVLNSPTQCYCFAIHIWRYCGPLLHEFHHQHYFSVPESSYYQLSGRQRLFKLLRLVWWMCVHPLLWLLFGFNIHKRNPGFITWHSYDVIEKLIARLCNIDIKKSKRRHSLSFGGNM